MNDSTPVEITGRYNILTPACGTCFGWIVAAIKKQNVTLQPVTPHGDALGGKGHNISWKLYSVIAVPLSEQASENQFRQRHCQRSACPAKRCRAFKIQCDRATECGFQGAVDNEITVIYMAGRWIRMA